jgi:hypothetical protein
MSHVVAVITSLLLTAVACGDSRRHAAVIGATLRDDRTLVLTIAACNGADNRAAVDENDDAVMVKITTDDPRGDEPAATVS